MQILCFAHRLEALCFLEKDNYQSLNTHLFKGKENYLLITGEGLQNATETLIESLSLYPEIDTVINFGVAAGNPDVVKIQEIYEIRSLYRQKSNANMEFRSFTTAHPQAQKDLISVESRIQNAQEAASLFLFAPILDREAWALASAAQYFKKDFYCFKYISDDASREACSQIKEIAREISSALYKHYSAFSMIQTTSNSLELPPGFHFTFTQQSDFKKLLEKIARKENKSFSEILNSLPTYPQTKAKEKTKQLLEDLQQRLDPFTYSIRQKLHFLFEAFKRPQVIASYDKTLEKDDIQFTITAKNPEELKEAIQHLNTFSFQKVQKLFRGENVD